MNQSGKIISAIDIGTTKIVAIVGQKNEQGKLQILGLGKAPSLGVKRGVVQNIEETSKAISIAVKQAEEQAGVKIKNVFVGIAGQHVRSLKNRGNKYIKSPLSEISQEDVDQLIKDMHNIPLDAGEEIIHIIPQDYIVDNESSIRIPVGMSGRKLEGNFHIVIGQIASAQNIKRCIQRAGLKVISLILEPLASASAVLSEDEKEAGVVLIDIGGGTTDLAIFHDGVIHHSAVIPLGGDLITKDIKEGVAILYRHAEQIKLKFGCALAEMAPIDKVIEIPGISGRDPKEISFNTLSKMIQARMEEIIDAFMFEIENSNILHKLSAGIAITGGGSLLKHLNQLVKFKTGLDVRLGIPNKTLAADNDDRFTHPMYSTSIGLLIKGFEMLDDEEKETVLDDELEFEEEGEADNNLFKKSKDTFVKSIKDSIVNFFEDKDAEM